MSNFNYNTLCHHGIKGQKWGIRRYQNEDGSLTAEGRKRYGVDSNGFMTKEGKKLYEKDNKATKYASKEKKSILTGTSTGSSLGALAGIGTAFVETVFVDGAAMEEHPLAGLVILGGRTVAYGSAGAAAGAAVGATATGIYNKKISNGKKYVDKVLK